MTRTRTMTRMRVAMRVAKVVVEIEVLEVNTRLGLNLNLRLRLKLRDASGGLDEGLYSFSLALFYTCCSVHPTVKRSEIPNPSSPVRKNRLSVRNMRRKLQRVKEEIISSRVSNKRGRRRPILHSLSPGVSQESGVTVQPDPQEQPPPTPIPIPLPRVQFQTHYSRLQAQVRPQSRHY